MLLWEELLGINELTLYLMHCEKDIRANYAVCVCGQKVIAGSVAVIQFFHCIFVMGKMAKIYPKYHWRDPKH